MSFNSECNRLSMFCRAFSNRLRLEIICTLRSGEKTVSEITQNVNASKHNVSQQLKYLRETDVLNSRKDGRNIYYKLANQEILGLLEGLMDNLSDTSHSEWFEKIHDCQH